MELWMRIRYGLLIAWAWTCYQMAGWVDFEHTHGFRFDLWSFFIGEAVPYVYDIDYREWREIKSRTGR